MLPSQAPRILVVDDEESIRRFVSFNLDKEGYSVETAEDGDIALRKAGEESYDLIVLDIMLPGIDGFEVLRRLRAAGQQVPVLFLSARDTELDKVVGLEIGGDDYLAKPFGIRELQARVKALLRRSAGASTTKAAPEPQTLEVGELTLDEGAHDAFWTDRRIDLTPREFELLACLMRHPGTVLSREQLLREAWGWEILVETKTVDTHIKRLRDKLAAVGADPDLVDTVRGYGYRLQS